MATRFYASSPGYSPRGSRQRHKSRTHYCVPGRRESACCARTGPATRHSPVGDRSWSLTAISSRRSPRADAHGLRGTAHAATARPPFHVAEAHGPTRKASRNSPRGDRMASLSRRRSPRADAQGLAEPPTRRPHGLPRAPRQHRAPLGEAPGARPSRNSPRGDRMAFLEHLANIERLSEELQAQGLRGTAHAATACPSLQRRRPTGRRTGACARIAHVRTQQAGCGLCMHRACTNTADRQSVACACIAHVRTQLTGKGWPVHASRMYEHR